MRSDAGFTLIEVLVATFIMALLSVMGVSMLSAVVDARRASEDVIERVEGLVMARTLIKRDLSQLSPRRPRSEYGERLPAALQGGNDLDNRVLMSFVTRVPRIGADLSVRDQLQFVTYRRDGNRLIRVARDAVDAVPDTPVTERVLLSGIDDLRVRFRRSATWTEVLETSAGASVEGFPTAVEFSFNHPAWGDMALVFSTGGGAP